jgi:O-antigen ligase
MPKPSPQAKVIRVVRRSNATPPRFVEYGYYLSFIYGIMGSAYGFSTNLLGAGMLMALAVLCIMSLRSRAMSVCAQIAFPLGCAVSFVVLQILLYHKSLMAEDVRYFVTWTLALIIIQSLSLRQGFLHRFAFITFGVGLLTLPYMRSFMSNLEFERVDLEHSIAIANANDFAAWFGFCAVYFTIVGLEAKRNVSRIPSLLIAVGCLYVIGLTVSRGTLLAVAIAIVIALRRLLKRGFIPVLSLIIFSWTIYELGLFERSAAFYSARATQETGRFLVWPLAIKRFLSSPLAGVGVSNIATHVLGIKEPFTPHNSFLFIALASGIIPLAFFVSYWWRAAKGVLRANAQGLADAPFQIPLLIYAFLVAQQGNAPFMAPWMIVTLSTAIAAGVSCPVRRIAIPRIVRGETTASIRHSREAGSAPGGYKFRTYPPRT